jgi:hypothetical protein
MRPVGGPRVRGCCVGEAKKNVKKHRDVATCDECGRLVLGYGNESEWKKTQDELKKSKVTFEVDKIGSLWIISKERAAGAAAASSGALDDDDEGGDDDDD